MRKYSLKVETEHTARAMGVNLPISRKNAIEICNFIRSRNTEKAKKILKNTIEMKQPIPFTRFKLKQTPRIRDWIQTIW